jgi:hypothetical protein
MDVAADVMDAIGGDFTAQRTRPPAVVDVVGLLDKVDFEPENVVAASATNSVLYVDAINYRLQCLTRKADAEMASKRAWAEAELVVRDAAKRNDDKITEGHVKALLNTDPVVMDAARELADAEAFDEYSKLVVKVFEMRRDCLQIVSKWTHEEMRVQGVADAAREELRSTRDKARSRFPAGR